MGKKKKVKKWSARELALLKKLYPHCKRTLDVARQLGRPLTTVRQKAYDLGIKTEKYRPWSADELELLRELYQVKGLKELAEQLGEVSRGGRRTGICDGAFERIQASGNGRNEEK